MSGRAIAGRSLSKDKAIGSPAFQRLVKGHQLCLVAGGERNQIRIRPELGGGIRRDRQPPKLEFQIGWLGEQGHAVIPEQRVIYVPSVRHRQRLAVHRGGGGEQAQDAELGDARKSGLFHPGVVPPLEGRSTVHMVFQDQGQPYIHIRETQ